MRRQARRTCLYALALVALGGGALRLCASAQPRSAPTPFPVTELEGRPCAPRTPPGEPVSLAFDVTVFRGPGVSDEELDAQLAQLAAYYQPYGVRFFQRGPVTPLDIKWLLGGTRAEIDAALRSAGIDPDTPPRPELARRARRITCRTALAPLIAFLARHGDDEHDSALRLVVTRRLDAPGSTAAGMLPHLRGLTVGRGANASPEVERCLGVTDQTPPTILIALDEIAGRRPGTVDVTLAHEVGHALGLTHADRRNDLMAVEPPTCVPALSAEQWATLTTYTHHGQEIVQPSSRRRP
jgi:hypothetical protein